MLRDFVEKFQKEMELAGPLTGTESGSFSFMFADTEIELFDASAGEFRLMATLGPMPSGKEEDFMTHMLRANLFGQATFGGLLGLDRTGNFVLLQRLRQKAKNYQDFTHAVEEFLNAVDFWTKEIKNYSSHP
jgi:hypothetical protein